MPLTDDDVDVVLTTDVIAIGGCTGRTIGSGGSVCERKYKPQTTHWRANRLIHARHRGHRLKNIPTPPVRY